MKELDKKDTPAVAGAQLDQFGNPLATAYPIFPVASPEQPMDTLIVPESPLP